MKFTERVTQYNIHASILKELVKTSREYCALATLKYAFPEMFSKMKKHESPDFIDEESGLGVEITSGEATRFAVINGESNNICYAKTDKERDKCLERIRKNGGDKKGPITYYPTFTDDTVLNSIQNIFIKKTKKAEEYLAQCTKLGIVIIIDVPISTIDTNKLWKMLEKKNNNKFDFVAIMHWSGIDIYNFQTGEYSSRVLDSQERNALKVIGRMTAEGIIHIDDPEWY